MGRRMGVGAQFTISLATQYKVPDIVRLAEVARRNGIERIWVNDNLRYRNTFVVLAAIASKVRVKLGTAVAVPYFRNPLDLADSVASLSELAQGDLAIGLARGSTAQAGHLLRLERPVTALNETALFLQRALAGEKLVFRDYPFLTEEFHMNPDASAQLSFRPGVPVQLYCGGNSPKSLEVGGRTMDGVLIGGYFEAFVKMGRLDRLLEVAERASRTSDPAKRLRKVAEVNVSVSRDAGRAREDAKKYASHSMMSLRKMGVTPDEFRSLGVEQGDLDALERAFAMGVTIEEATSMVTDEMVDAVMVAGDVAGCRDKVLDYCKAAASRGFDEVAFAKLGPDYDEALALIGKEIVPSI